ncbi:lysyl-tRNA synthetase, class 2 [Thiohalospira halophila DSM 15071]|uniref:Lysyl-tRNA synthetase, class 2 n=1 Tax=Thiohalospira halophila DSM 15071 TaxID=1123397 RepID=A0A1I1U1X9_9GAMM|nr:EF-P lysine aminoacylase EpmA [Thiohalospira halophila]SFD64881.1 lysyl-tRNA synthetase, class 2 [Thiohalospira halophila DSM 15071]
MAADWRPTADRAALAAAAAVRRRLRDFLEARGYLEVETPQLSAAANPDPAVEPFSVAGDAGPLWLATSPEFPMKRLLAADSGPIYQMARAFRREEQGRRHNPEFTLLEWYAPGVAPAAFIAEAVALAAAGLGAEPAVTRLSYADAFHQACGVDPHRADAGELAEAARAAGLVVTGLEGEGDPRPWRHLLQACLVEPALAERGLVVVSDFPADDAALARLRPADDPKEPAVAERFEIYLHGLELANGYHELADPAEQRRRFEDDNDRRRLAGQQPLPVDEHLLAALEAGLPDACGMAMGVDRLIMAATGAVAIEGVLAFPVDRA